MNIGICSIHSTAWKLLLLLFIISEFGSLWTVSQKPVMAARTLLASLACAGVTVAQIQSLAVSINADEITTGTPLDGFVSYSIEFASFPDFAGKRSSHTSCLMFDALG